MPDTFVVYNIIITSCGLYSSVMNPVTVYIKGYSHRHYMEEILGMVERVLFDDYCIYI